MHYYSYVQAVYDATYEQALENQILASRIRRSRIEEEIEIQHRLRRSRIQAEIEANKRTAQVLLRRSRVQRQLAIECNKREIQLQAEMTLTESILGRSRRQQLLAASEQQLERSKATSEQLDRSIEEETLAMTKIQSQQEVLNSSRRRQVVEEDISRILTTY